MTILGFSLILVALIGLVIGSWSIYWARGSDEHHQTHFGRKLFIFSLICLGTLGLVAALEHADELAPLGLVACFLVVAMLWDSPATATVESRARY